MIRAESLSIPRRANKTIVVFAPEYISILAALFCFFFLTEVPAAGAGTVSGKFSLESGAQITPRSVAAFPVREQYDARAESIEIVLSTEPIDATGSANALNPHTDAINHDALRKDNYILLWVTPAGQVSLNATFAATMTQYLDRSDGRGSLIADLTANTPNRVAGRVSLSTPVKVMSGESYSYDITFDVDVTRPENGTPLADGGAPGLAFKALLAAVKKKNWPALRSGVSERLRNMFDVDYRSAKENLDFAVSSLQMSLPKTGIKVTQGTLRGEIATLEIEGEIFAGQKAVYFVRMVKNKNAWLYDGAALAGLVK